MEQRNRGGDLLRMVAMWMVVILHILNKGSALGASAPLSAGRETALLLDMAAYCAVDCYGMISGYVVRAIASDTAVRLPSGCGRRFIRCSSRRPLRRSCRAASTETGCYGRSSRCCFGSTGM